MWKDRENDKERKKRKNSDRGSKKVTMLKRENGCGQRRREKEKAECASWELVSWFNVIS